MNRSPAQLHPSDRAPATGLDAPAPGTGVPDADQVPPRPGAITALLASTTLLRVGTAGAAVAVAFDLVDMFGGRPSGVVLGFVGASQALPEMVFSPFLATYADRLGRRLFLVGGPLVSLLGAILLSLATAPGSIVVARLVEGIGAACFIPTALGTIAAATAHDREVRARASGAFEGANLAGYAGGFVVGPFAYHSLHHGAFLLLGALYLLAGLTCLACVPRVPPLPVSPLRRVASAALGPGPIRAFLPAWIAAFALIGAYAAHLPALLRRLPVHGQSLVHHFDERVVSLILVAWIVLILVGIALWTRSIPRLGSVRTMRLAVPGAWLISAVLLTMNHTPLVWSIVLLPLLVAGVLVLAGFGPAAVNYLADSSERFAADRAAFMSFYTVALAGGGAIGSILGGFAVRLGLFDGLALLGFALSLVAYVALRPLQRYDDQQRQSGPGTLTV